MNVSEAATLPAQGRSRRWYSHPYNRGRYYRLARLVARALPRRGRRALAGVLARVALRILPAERESVRENLRRVLPGVDGRGLDAAVWGTFRNFALCFGDLLTLNRAPVERLSRYLDGVEGEGHLAAASAPGRGLIVATAHLGNWELEAECSQRSGGAPPMWCSPARKIPRWRPSCVATAMGSGS